MICNSSKVKLLNLSDYAFWIYSVIIHSYKEGFNLKQKFIIASMWMGLDLNTPKTRCLMYFHEGMESLLGFGLPGAIILGFRLTIL